MSIEPRGPHEVPEHERALGYPTDELPTYRTVQPHPQPAPTAPTAPAASAAPTPSWPGSTGELPVTAGPAASAAPRPPRGPYVPTIVRGLFVLVLVAVVFVWRLADDPNWAVVGITLAAGVGGVLLLAALTGLVVRRVQRDRDFDRMLSGS